MKKNYIFEQVQSGSRAVGHMGRLFIFMVFALGYSAYVTAQPGLPAPISGPTCTSWLDAGTPGLSTSGVFGTSMAISLDGTPYIGFSDGTPGNKAVVKKFDGSTWVALGEGGLSTSVFDVSVAVDNSGVPYVAYTDYNLGSKLVVLKYNGTSWDTVGGTPVSGGSIGYPSLLIDGTGTPYVAYMDYQISKVAVKRYVSGSWSYVGSTGISEGTGYYCAMKKDAAGNIYVVYMDAFHDFKATVMKYDGSSWTALGGAGFTAGEARNAGLALNSAGVPYIIYKDGSLSDKATVQKYESGSWSVVGTAGFSAATAETPAIVMDPMDVPYIAYLDYGATYNVIAKKFDGANWVPLGAGPVYNYYGINISMVIDAAGKPYVGYSDAGINKASVKQLSTYSIAINGVQTACTGNSTTLTDVVAGGTWQTSDYSIGYVDYMTGTVYGFAQGTATISYVLPVGCVATAVVTVNQTPLVNPGSGATVCSGTQVTLSATGAATYSWTGGITNGVAFTPSVGTNVYTVTGTAANGCSNTGTATVIANALPAVGATGGGTACFGTSFALSGTGAYYYSWTGGISNGSSFTPATGINTYTVTGTDGNGCSNTATATITINPIPEAGAITGPVTVGVGSSIILSNTSATPGGTWSSSAAGVAAVNSTGTVTGTGTGTATISYNISNSCGAATATFDLTVTLQPIVGPSAICVGESGVFTTASAPGLSWTSSDLSVATVGSSSGQVTGIAPGTTTVVFTALNGATTTMIVTVNPAPAAITGTMGACVGATTSLASAAPGGTWSSSNVAKAAVNATSGVVSGIGAGTSIITYTLSTGCRAISVVTINSTPSAIGGASAICIGSTSALTNTLTGGNWSSDDAGIASVSGSGVVTGISGGVTNISYSMSAGCARALSVTVNAIPAIAGNTNMCLGTAATLTNATSGGTWLSSTPAVATVSGTGVVTGIATGTATVTYTVGSGCRTTAVVTVNATLPDITGPSIVCVNSTATLSNTTTGGTWTTAASTATVNPSTGAVSGITAGTAIITYTVATGCSKTFIITVKPLPAAISGVAAVCTGATTVFTDATTGGLSWTSSSPATATVNGSGVVTGVAAGNATITYTVTSGCSVTKDITVNAAPAAITGITSVCTGSATTLSSASAGGTWASNAPAIATVGSASGIVTGVAASVTSITYNLNGCKAVTSLSVLGLPAAIGGTLGICTGVTSLLSSATTGGTWSSSAPAIASIGSTGLVTAAGVGNTTISYTMATGCARTAVVTVSALPSISGITTICAGSASTLSSTSTGGTWSSSAAGIASVGAATGIVNGIANGVANITYALSPNCKSVAPVTIGAGPAAITGANAVCLGSTATVSDATAGGAWSSSNPATIAIDPATGIMTGVAAGSATISYATGAACYRTRSIIVGSGSATLSGSFGLCVGSTTVMVSVAPATGESWTSSNPAVASVGSSSGLVTGLSAGTALITFTPYSTGGNAGCIATQILTVAATPSVAAITGVSSVGVGQTITLADATPSGVWSSSNTAKATVSAGGVVTGVAGAAAVISYTVSNGVCQVAATKSITITAARQSVTGEDEASVVKVYPNPTSGSFIIATSVAGSFTIYTVEGKALLQQPVIAGNNAVQLPQGIAAGIYMCRIDGTDGSSTMVRLVYEQ